MFTYDGLDYILGYYAHGPQLTFCILEKNIRPNTTIFRLSQRLNSRVKVRDVRVSPLKTFYLQNFYERLKCWNYCRNLGRLLSRLDEELKTSRKEIYFFQTLVVKIYENQELHNRVDKVYELLNQYHVPHCDRLVYVNPHKRSLTFTPTRQARFT